jgi:hypothetical protein
VVIALWALIAVAASVVWAMHLRLRKWPRQWRDKYTWLGRVKRTNGRLT